MKHPADHDYPNPVWWWGPKLGGHNIEVEERIDEYQQSIKSDNRNWLTVVDRRLRKEIFKKMSPPFNTRTFQSSDATEYAHAHQIECRCRRPNRRVNDYWRHWFCPSIRRPAEITRMNQRYNDTPCPNVPVTPTGEIRILHDSVARHLLTHNATWVRMPAWSAGQRPKKCTPTSAWLRVWSIDSRSNKNSFHFVSNREKKCQISSKYWGLLSSKGWSNEVRTRGNFNPAWEHA